MSFEEVQNQRGVRLTGPISEINPVLRNIRVNVANPITPATILTTNAQRYFYFDNVKIASWANRLGIDSLVANTPVIAYDVYSNRPVSSNVSVTFVYNIRHKFTGRRYLE